MLNETSEQLRVHIVFFVGSVCDEVLQLIELLNTLQVGRCKFLFATCFVQDELIRRILSEEQVHDLLHDVQLFLQKQVELDEVDVSAVSSTSRFASLTQALR